ncbi:accessory gene regulator ArgB-like protein [Desulfitobacterium hafniense]|uniref:Accessory regulator AgrB n=1 Tax=Desulfitobacterium hafniense TaxID=49338 RepID=A0A0W1JMJ1_DESHA|nr:accessory gene regulator B family protein [Desulfitobacterium hafniense]KTE92800.1 accessory regulator AgrB [Desulfitobacterium hafniense]
MINLADLSSNVTKLITRELDYDEDKKEIIAYAIETSLLAIIGTLLLILFAMIINVLKSALIAAVFGVLLRRVSGGAHFSTPTKCLVFGAVLYTILGFLAQNFVQYQLIPDYMIWLSLAISLLIVAFLAPVDSESKPIHSKSLRKKLKASSVGFVVIAFIVGLVSTDPLLNVSMCLGILYQSLTLLPLFNRGGGG